MSQLRLYLDEDSMNRALLLALRQRDIDVISVNEVERVGLADELQLQWATSQNRAICTYNARDFCQLHTQFLSSGQHHAGIVLMRQDFSVGERLYGLSALVAAISTEEIRNQRVFLSQFLRRR
jgi:hypothetical protein